jgi:hypothetical protein
MAALAIASLALILSMQVLLQSARVDARLTHEVAARDLERRLLAEGTVGRGQAGVLTWSATLTPYPDVPLALREVSVTWPDGPVLTTGRIEAVP